MEAEAIEAAKAAAELNIMGGLASVTGVPTNSQQTNVLITFAFPFTTIDFFLELTDNQRQCVLIYQLDAVGVLAKGEHRHRVPGSLACPRGCAGSLGLRK